MPRWLTYALLATVLWGIWGTVSALVSREVSPLVTQVICTLGAVPASLLLLFSPNWKRGTNFKLGILFASLTGLCANTGNLCLLRAFRLEGPVSIVLPVSSLYPLVTALLAVLFLRERLNRIQAIGFAMALIAIYMVGIATSGAPASEGLHDLHVGALTTPWMLWTFGALVLFGATCFFQKIATFHFSNELCTIVFALVTIPIAGAILFFGPDLSFKLSGKVWLLSLLFGALVGIGSLAQFAAYRWGKGSVVTALTGLYPAITILLAVPLLKERLDAPRIIAVAVALAAGVALSYETGETSTMEADLSSV